MRLSVIQLTGIVAIIAAVVTEIWFIDDPTVINLIVFGFLLALAVFLTAAVIDRSQATDKLTRVINLIAGITTVGGGGVFIFLSFRTSSLDVSSSPFLIDVIGSAIGLLIIVAGGLMIQTFWRQHPAASQLDAITNTPLQ